MVSFHVVIKTRFEKKPFMIGEYVIPGKRKEEILWVSDICHPNQVNDSISGAVVAAQLAKELSKGYDGYFTIRFLFLDFARPLCKRGESKSRDFYSRTKHRSYTRYPSRSPRFSYLVGGRSSHLSENLPSSALL